MKILLLNTLTKQTFEYNNLVDMNNGKTPYMRFNIDTAELEDGEYILELYDDSDTLISTELAKKGDYTNPIQNNQYQPKNNKYITYNSQNQ